MEFIQNSSRDSWHTLIRGIATALGEVVVTSAVSAALGARPANTVAEAVSIRGRSTTNYRHSGGTLR